MNSPFFTLIIPTYNISESIGATLDSIINQTYKNIEVLLLDSISQDHTCEIVKEFQKKCSYIHLISEKDQGVYDAMNKGVELAKGDYLFFMGGDDVFYDTNTLQQVFNSINEGDDFIYGNVLFKESKLLYSGKSNLKKLIYDQISICHQAIFYSKRVFELIGNFNLKYFIHADYDFNIRCFIDNKLRIKYIDQIIAVFNETGLSGTKSNADGFHTELTENCLYSKYLDDYLVNENARLKRQMNQLRHSKTFRIGTFLLGPLKLLRKTKK
ncbi:glycosyltransferase family 2 protein [Gaetbulibacter sp. M235]|uniref:glycosyltransferase family 2 protein n=1 Tax=Gaetbulibacter sp. M235 TaxID=3126510 RepID=UPI00374F9743